MEILSRFGGRIDWTSLVTKRYSLDEVEQALRDVEALRVVKAVILPGTR